MGHRLLVVDSDRRFLQEQRAALASAFDTEFLESTDQALPLLEDGSFAAVLVCAEASENKGYSLCSSVRRSPALAGVKVALISARATEEEYARHQALKVRADLYLHKPIRPNLLVSALAPLVPLRAGDPDNPLDEPAGGDLGEEWLEGLRHELESDSATRPLPPLRPVSAVLGLDRPGSGQAARFLAAGPDPARAERLEARIRDLEAQLAAANGKLEKTTRSLEDLQRQGQEAQTLFEERTLAALELETRLAGADRDLEAARREEAEARSRLAAEALAVQDLEARLQTSAATVQELETVVRSKDPALEDLDRRLRQATQAALDLEARLGERDQAVQGLEARLDERDQAIQGLEARLAERDLAARDLESRLATVQADLDQLGQDLEESRQQEEQARSEFQDKTQLTLDLMEANELLQAQLAEAQEGLDRLRASLEGRQAGLDAEQVRLRTEHQAALEDRDARLAAQESELAGLRDRFQGLAQERDAAAGQLRSCADRLASLAGALLDLEQPLGRILELARSEMNKQ